MCFVGKVAVITGAGGGMGFAIARALQAGGARLGLIDLKLPSELTGGADQNLLCLEGDVSDPDFIAEAFTGIGAQFGRLDYLVNAAGVLWFGKDRSLVDTKLEVWDRVLEINLKSMVLTARHAVPLMRRTSPEKPAASGAMVHIASIQALRGDTQPQDAYQASKAAMISLSKSIAIQFAGDGIRSNCLLPGGALTGMQQRWHDDGEKLAAAAAAVPLGRVGSAEDMAAATLFLLSDKASFITGTELVVDGGRTALP